MADTGERGRVDLTTRLKRAALILGSAALVALVVGILEAGVLGFRFASGEFIWSSRHSGWMAPLSWLGFFGVAAIPFALLSIVLPRLSLTPVVAGLAAMVAGYGFLRLASLQRLHPVAMAVVAIGLGLQIARIARDRPGSWERLVRRGVPGLGLVVALLGIGSVGLTRWRERQGIASLPAARTGAPNVLLLVLDTVRGANMSLYGYSRETTPNIARIAARGVVFDWAFSTAPWTLPSHASMFTGHFPWDLSAGFKRRLDDRYPTLAERFRAQGYLTAGFAANHIFATYETGLDRGFDHFEDYLVSPRQVALNSELGQLISSKRSGLAIRATHRAYAPTVNRQVLDWVPTVKDRPFFMFVNYMDAHLPYGTPAHWVAKFKGDSGVVDRYDAALARLDHAVGELVDSLTVRGAMDNTILIITADHGEHLGDHGMDDHANSLYSQLLHVPLVVVQPSGAAAGTRVDAAVSLIDLAPTILDLAGLPGDSTMPGSSLAGLWQGGQVSDSVLFAQVDQHPLKRSWFRNRDGPIWAAIDPEYHFIVNTDSSLELFRYREDRAEETNVASTAGQHIIDDFKSRLTTLHRP